MADVTFLLVTRVSSAPRLLPVGSCGGSRAVPGVPSQTGVWSLGPAITRVLRWLPQLSLGFHHRQVSRAVPGVLSQTGVCSLGPAITRVLRWLPELSLGFYHRPVSVPWDLLSLGVLRLLPELSLGFHHRPVSGPRDLLSLGSCGGSRAVPGVPSQTGVWSLGPAISRGPAVAPRAVPGVLSQTGVCSLGPAITRVLRWLPELSLGFHHRPVSDPWVLLSLGSCGGSRAVPGVPSQTGVWSLGPAISRVLRWLPSCPWGSITDRCPELSLGFYHRPVSGPWDRLSLGSCGGSRAVPGFHHRQVSGPRDRLSLGVLPWLPELSLGFHHRPVSGPWVPSQTGVWSLGTAITSVLRWLPELSLGFHHRPVSDPWVLLLLGSCGSCGGSRAVPGVPSQTGVWSLGPAISRVLRWLPSCPWGSITDRCPELSLGFYHRPVSGPWDRLSLGSCGGSRAVPGFHHRQVSGPRDRLSLGVLRWLPELSLGFHHRPVSGPWVPSQTGVWSLGTAITSVLRWLPELSLGFHHRPVSDPWVLLLLGSCRGSPSCPLVSITDRCLVPGFHHRPESGPWELLLLVSCGGFPSCPLVSITDRCLIPGSCYY
ncbi:hypothetical protein NDU88_007267 [Pleurodeles waltl]|uniref:Uncharacterized protein n=1 Tax=Pleurodeles waltl TaxID=8319 RepID=A0AAV7MPS5_PLEWA|nr:hypothetical protein NDU88_007267 [Pleurodeles waltl]